MKVKEKTSLYRHYDDKNNLLYVGISLNALNRLYQHGGHSDWFDDIKIVKIEHFESRREAVNAERKAIKNEKPLYNIQHKISDLEKIKKEKEKQQRESLANRKESLSFIYSSLVQFKPVHTLQETADVLRISVDSVKRLINQKKLSAIYLGERRINVKKNITTPVLKVTGWQILDYLETLPNYKEAQK